MKQNKIANDPYEVTEFLVKRMLQKGVTPETIILGLQKAGVDGHIIVDAFNKINEADL